MKLLIDTDPGVDDAWAILMALADPGVEVLGLSVVAGNVGLGHCLRNACKLLEVAGREDIPVFPGAAQAIAGRSNAPISCTAAMALATPVICRRASSLSRSTRRARSCAWRAPMPASFAWWRSVRSPTSPSLSRSIPAFPDAWVGWW